MVEDGVLGRADVDEGRLHAREHVLDPAPVDVAVDLGGVVGRPGDVVLDQGPPLEQGDLGHLRANMDTDHVATDRFAPALPSAAAALGPPVSTRARRATSGLHLAPAPSGPVVAARLLCPADRRTGVDRRRSAPVGCRRSSASRRPPGDGGANGTGGHVRCRGRGRGRLTLARRQPPGRGRRRRRRGRG